MCLVSRSSHLAISESLSKLLKEIEERIERMECRIRELNKGKAVKQIDAVGSPKETEGIS